MFNESTKQMISVQKALDIVTQNMPGRSHQSISLQHAQNSILAEDIHAVEPMPAFTNSAMDGYAVRWQDVATATPESPVTLRVVGEGQAGVPYPGTLRSGEAIRISTGAMICAGADTVIPVEEVSLEDAALRVTVAHSQHQHLRYGGEEYQPGDHLLAEGTPLRPAQMAVLASQGIKVVNVWRPASLAIIGTGSELVSHDVAPGPGQIRDSNGIMLAAAVRASGSVVNSQRRVGDDFTETVTAIESAAVLSDVIIFTGGVSVGPHDLVKRAAQKCGFTTLFWRVQQKPGKPLFFARKNNCLFWGLPGNPVSAYMCYLFYIQPLLKYLNGGVFEHRSVYGKTAERLQNPLPRAQLFRVTLEAVTGQLPLVRPLKKQGSHMLTSITDAAGFVLLKVDEEVPAETIIRVFSFV